MKNQVLDKDYSEERFKIYEVDGIRGTLKEFADYFNVDPISVSNLVLSGMSIQDALISAEDGDSKVDKDFLLDVRDGSAGEVDVTNVRKSELKEKVEKEKEEKEKKPAKRKYTKKKVTEKKAVVEKKRVVPKELSVEVNVPEKNVIPGVSKAGVANNSVSIQDLLLWQSVSSSSSDIQDLGDTVVVTTTTTTVYRKAGF